MTSIALLRAILTGSASLLVASSNADTQLRVTRVDAAVLFARLDADGDGRLSSVEFLSLAALGRRRSESRPDVFGRLFQWLDADHDGELSHEEFRELPAFRGTGNAPAQPTVARRAAQRRTTSETAKTSASREADFLRRDAIDPEIHGGKALMIYQDARGAIWLEHLDPLTGLAKAGGQPRIQLDTGAASLRQTFNGPEFGTDVSGWAAYYTKPSGAELQIWRATLENGNARAEPVFRDGKRRQSVLASKDDASSAARIIYIKGDLQTGSFHWADVATPDHEHRIDRTQGVDSPRWIDGTLTFVYAEAEGAARGQIKLHDTLTGRTSEITSDAGVKSFAYGWKAPEFNGEIVVLGLVDKAAIGIWRQTRTGDWQRVQTIVPPRGSRHAEFGSPEPVVFGGRSYISAVVKSASGTLRFRDSEVWLFGVDSPGAIPYSTRVSDDSAASRSDPESLVTPDQIHLFYNVFREDLGYRIEHAGVAPRAKISRSGDLGTASSAKVRDFSRDIERRPLEIGTLAAVPVHDARRKKDLQLRINYPKSGGPYPVIVFSHGAWGSKDGHLMLTELWASHGYVTIQPNHSDSRALSVRVGDTSVFRDWQSRPADVSFILDSLSLLAAEESALEGKFDVQNIGVVGHSFGANTAQLIGGAKAIVGGREMTFADPRATAVALLSGQGAGEMLTPESWAHFTKPLLVMTGSRDGPTRTGQPAVWRKQPYELSPSGNKHLVWVEGMDHGFGGVAGLPAGFIKFQTNEDHVRYTKMITLAFWDAYLKRDPRSKQYLESGRLAALSDGTVRMEHK